MEEWKELLKAAVERHGYRKTAEMLHISKTTISLILNDKYPADTTRIEERVLVIFGGERIECPVLGEITKAECLLHQKRAREIGTKAGNPRTLKLYLTCLECKGEVE